MAESRPQRMAKLSKILTFSSDSLGFDGYLLHRWCYLRWPIEPPQTDAALAHFYQTIPWAWYPFTKSS